MSLDRMLQVLLPQPGDDLRSWAQSLVTQLQMLLQQQANDTTMLSSQPATAPLYQDDGHTLVITEIGEYKLADGTVIVDADGLHVKDAVGFDVINGPVIRIDTQHLVDAAVETVKLATGAVTTTTIADGAITTPKLVAGSVVAGKIAANAIVAGDGVIANAAIVDAQIATLNASKINAGDISAARMSTNIVTALSGKFATLSALAASLGVVSIQTGGALSTQGVTTYTSGTGIWMGDHSGTYKMRIGNPSGARLDWDGSSLSIYNQYNQLVLASGAYTQLRNYVAPFVLWAMDGTNWVHTNSAYSADGTTLVIPSGSDFVASSSPTMALSAATWTISFKAYSSVAGRRLYVDLFPDTLPETSFVLTTVFTEYSFTFASSHADLASCFMRFFADSAPGQIEIADVQLVIGNTKVPFAVFQRSALVSPLNKVSEANIGTYIASAAITTAYIKDANITTAKIADANITSAKIADANITTAKIGSLQVTTLKIADAAVTAPYFVLGTNTTMVTAFPTEYTLATFNITTSEVTDIVVIVTARFINNAGVNLTGSIVITTGGYGTTHRGNRVDANWEDTMTVSEIFTDAAAGSRTIDVKGRINVNNASGITVSDITCSAVVYKK